MADNDMADGDLGRRLAAAQELSIATHVVELTSSTAMVHQQQRSVYARRPLPEIILLDDECVDMRLPFLGLGEQVSWTPTDNPPSQYGDGGVTAVPASHLSQIGR